MPSNKQTKLDFSQPLSFKRWFVETSERLNVCHNLRGKKKNHHRLSRVAITTLLSCHGDHTAYGFCQIKTSGVVRRDSVFFESPHAKCQLLGSSLSKKFLKENFFFLRKICIWIGRVGWGEEPGFGRIKRGQFLEVFKENLNLK